MEQSSGFRFWDAVKAGFMATVILTIIMALFGMDSMKSLGHMLMGSSASKMQLYLAGGALHFGIGIFYGFLYALILAPISAFNALVKAIIFSVIITAAAFYGMPKMPDVIAKIKGDESHMMNPCNPCHMENSYNMNPCAMKDDLNSMNPCNPCAAGDKKAIITSWMNHFIFALVVGMLYRRRKM